MKVMVLGSGPAGLLAALAVQHKTNAKPLILAKDRRRSEMFGAQYLHKPIPELTATAGTEPILITYDLWGSVDEYREKVYGDTPVDSVSPEDLPEEHYAWDIRAAYNELWERYWPNIIERDLTKITEGAIADVFNSFDVVINTIPRPVLCRAGHQFQAQKIWAVGDAPERGIMSPVRVERNHVVCNGEPEPGWYRASNVFGYCTVEYPDGTRPPFPGGAEVFKPIKTNCDCWPNVIHAGRYGSWEKGVLSHDAYDKVIEALS